MSTIKKLANQTIVYGLSSIIGRLLNYLLVPLYTRLFLPEQFGVVTEFYSYVAFLMVLLTYGFETAYFRFSSNTQNSETVFKTAFTSLLITSTAFLGIIYLNAQSIATLLGYNGAKSYVICFGFVITFDVISSIIFAKLRSKGKALIFAGIKIFGILVNIGLVLFLLKVCPYLLYTGKLEFLHQYINMIYKPEIGIGYIFAANLAASAITFVLLVPFIPSKKSSKTFDFNIWKGMLKYAWPLMVVGVAGIINETFDKILLKYLLPYTLEQNMYYVGIYGACYKLSILMTLFIQAFRFAGEPFFFDYAREKDAKEIYAEVMDYFVIVGCIIFLLVTLYLDVFKHFIDQNYWNGLHVVPILLLANLFLGLYYNLSVWYKLTDKTHYGAYIAVLGSIITLELNYLLIPRIGYLGSAWATLICYGTMLLVSYLIGRNYYKVPYRVGSIVLYIALAIAIYASSIFIRIYFEIGGYNKFILNTTLFLTYLLVVYLANKASTRRMLKVSQ